MIYFILTHVRDIVQILLKKHSLCAFFLLTCLFPYFKTIQEFVLGLYKNYTVQSLAPKVNNFIGF